MDPDVLAAVAQADTDEWERAHDVAFEDTGLVTIDPPAAPACSERLVVTFRRPTPPPRPVTDFAEASHVEFPDEPPTEELETEPLRFARAETSGEWPPPPRAPAVEPAPQRGRRAAIYRVVVRPDTNS